MYRVVYETKQIMNSDSVSYDVKEMIDATSYTISENVLYLVKNQEVVRIFNKGQWKQVEKVE